MHMHVMFRLVGGDASPPSPPKSASGLRGLCYYYVELPANISTWRRLLQFFYVNKLQFVQA